MQKLTIPGRLCGLNELINGHWTVKAGYMDVVQWEIKAAKLKPVNNIVNIYIDCYEPNKRRDHDNVEGGAKKVILDALVKKKIIKDDSSDYIKKTYANTYYNKKYPRIEVRIEECK